MPGRRLLSASAILLLPPASVAAASAPGLALVPTESVSVSAGQMLGIADQLARSGQGDRAEHILDLLSNDPNPDVRSEARFRKAVLLEARGEGRAAAVLLRRVLDDRPNAAPVRLKLAATLQKMGDESAALRELRALRTSDLPLNVARFVDRLSASLQASKPLGFQLEVALAPDSNINRATRSDTLGTVLGEFTLDEGSQARSGVGAALRGFGQARHMLSDDLRLVARASGEANLYRDKDFNDITLDFAAGPEFRIGGARLGAEAGLTHQWYGMEPYQRSLRLAGNVIQRVDSVSQLRLDAGARWANNRFNDLQDGRGLSLRARYERALSPTLLVAGSVGIDRFKARDDAYSTRSWSAGLAAYKEMGRMTLSASLDVGRLKADEALSLFPEAREDNWARLSVGSVFRQFTVAGFAPVTRVVFERNQSNVAFYDYKRTRTEFGISRAF